MLQDNNIEDKGGEDMAEALKSNSTLQELWLYRNKVSETLDDHIKSLLSRVNRDKRRLAMQIENDDLTPAEGDGSNIH